MRLGDAMRAVGVKPEGLPSAPGWLERLRGLLELHIDQSRDVDDLAVAAAPVSGLAARMRVEVELRGEADHAGTTRRSLRRDAMLAAARLILRVDELASPEMVTTAGRVLVEPNAPTTVASRVRLWLDARAPGPAQLEDWWRAVEEAVCFAGHDAGVIAERRPAGMVLVRNATGVSHAPSEHVELDDAAAGARVVQAALEALA